MRVRVCVYVVFLLFKQKTAYEMRISDWSSDVCASDLDRSEHGRGKMLRVKMRQRTLAGLADPARRADGIDDIGFGHDAIPSFGERDLTGSHADRAVEIGRASCRESVCKYV